LRNPLSSIIGFSELLIKQLEEKDYEDAIEFAEIINRASKQAVELLKNLLLWAKTQSDRFEYSPEVLDCNSLVNEVIHLLEECARNKAITITNNTRPGLTVFSDKDVIHLILRNLISNGIKFTPKGGQIIISSTIQKNDVIVSIEDNGVGIKKENLDKLFDLDHKHTSPGTEEETGTGLGLLLCKEFINMYCGDIWADSSPGKGSTFYFTIPVTTG
jgi:two-component system, sensor histidine kinase and response regulator